MRIAWASDIHLNFLTVDQEAKFLARIHAAGTDLLLLGGDISTADRLRGDLIGIAKAVRQPVFFVLGNHDYYGSSIAAVRKNVAGMETSTVKWLPSSGPQEVAAGVTVVGHGGWGDARNGEFAESGVVLNDYVKIRELQEVFDLRAFTGRFGSGSALEKELRKLGDQAASTLSPQLARAAIDSPHVIVLTHVPPFKAACWHEGQISADDWLPGFSCGGVGEVLLAAAQAHPERLFTVLCGHTHSSGTARILDNLVVYTQRACYGQPDFQVLEAGPAGARQMPGPS